MSFEGWPHLFICPSNSIPTSVTHSPTVLNSSFPDQINLTNPPDLPSASIKVLIQSSFYTKGLILPISLKYKNGSSFFPIEKPAKGADLGRYVFVARLEVCDLVCVLVWWCQRCKIAVCLQAEKQFMCCCTLMMQQELASN